MHVQDPKIDYWMFLRYAMVFLLSHVGWIATVGHACCHVVCFSNDI